MKPVQLTFATLPLLTLGSAVLTSGASATDLEAPQNYICAAIDTMHCEGSSDCIVGSALDINIPLFFHLDMKEKVVSRKFPNGAERSSEIKYIQRENDQIFLQGMEDALGWTLQINESSGNMTLTASADDEAFVVFGACTTP